VLRILAGIAPKDAPVRVKGRTCVRLGLKPRISFAHRLQRSFVDGGAKYQLNLFAFASLLLLLVPISIGVRDATSVNQQGPSIDTAPRRQNLLPSPLGTIDRAVFTLRRPIGTLMPNFAEDWLVRIGKLADASLPGKPSEQNLLETVLTQEIAFLIANRFAEFNHEITRSYAELNKTPMLQISSGPAIIQNGFPSLAPMGYVRFCLRYVEDCKIHGNDFRRRTIALTGERWAELNRVNLQVNRDIIAQPDLGMATQDWSVHPKMGACYDYAVTKRHDLLARGWPSSALLLSEVVTASGEHHLVLVVRTTQGNVVLDNLNWNIRTVETVRYQWVRIQSVSNPKFWLAAVAQGWPSPRDPIGTVRTYKRPL
jgi:predicted transglutaminase-like cysteine proteinase